MLERFFKSQVATVSDSTYCHRITAVSYTHLAGVGVRKTQRRCDGGGAVR